MKSIGRAVDTIVVQTELGIPANSSDLAISEHLSAFSAMVGLPGFLEYSGWNSSQRTSNVQVRGLLGMNG